MHQSARIVCYVSLALLLVAGTPLLFGCRYTTTLRGSETFGYWGVDVDEPVVICGNDVFHTECGPHDVEVPVRHSIYMGKIVLYSPHRLRY